MYLKYNIFLENIFVLFCQQRGIQWVITMFVSVALTESGFYSAKNNISEKYISFMKILHEVAL